MTINDILVAALGHLNRGHDPQTLDVWRDKFIGFANDAQNDLAKMIRPRTVETIVVESGVFDAANLKKQCVKILEVKRDGKPVPFRSGDKTGLVRVLEEDGEVEVEYRYQPKRLSSSSDKPDLPEYAHYPIVLYVVAMERMSNDVSTQSGSDRYYQMYQQHRSAMMSHLGEPDAYTIKNRW